MKRNISQAEAKRELKQRRGDNRDVVLSLSQEVMTLVVAAGGPTFKQVSARRGFICNQTGERVGSGRTQAYAARVVNGALATKEQRAKEKKLLAEKAAKKQKEDNLPIARWNRQYSEATCPVRHCGAIKYPVRYSGPYQCASCGTKFRVVDGH